MNKIYRLKYDRRRNQLVAVSELTTGAGKETTGQAGVPADAGTFRKFTGTLTPLAFLTGLVMSFLPGMALANADLPTGGQIVAGQGSISTNGNQMTISQNTHGLVTNWNTFDVGQNHTVQFVQPDSSAVALNRVTGGHESQILGTLTANGQVMLVNPAGVMFGKGAKVNTAGLLASTKNISNADFMAGHYTFSGGSDAGAEVVNQGNLTTSEGGYIVLAANRVKNSGDISTPGGKTVLAAGDRVTLQLDNTGLASVSVSGSVVNALVENSGLLSATNGRVYLTARGKDMLLNTVVNNSGTIEAKGLNSRGGEIVLDGGDSGVVSQSGSLLADSAAGRGGKITVEGENIHLAANSRTSATGRTGGGEVYVGGGWQGKDSRIHNASKVVMDRTASVDVSATEDGNGGTAVLWSEDYTNFRGTILAKGGSRSGNGGQVETSSHNNLQAYGDADASAPAGKGGNWLLDPRNITIANTGSDLPEKNDGDTSIFKPSTDNATVSAGQISKKLSEGTSVTLVTSNGGTQDGNITFAQNASITNTGKGTVTLTLDADKNITINNSNAISSTGGKLNVNLFGAGSKDGTITLTGAKIESNGGHIFLGRKAGTETGKSLNIVSNNAVLNATIGNKVDANAGNITLKTDIGSGTTPAVNLTSSVFKGNNITIDGTTNTGGSGVKLTSNYLEAGGDLNITGNIQKANGGYGVNVAHEKAQDDNNFKARGTIKITATATDGSTGALHLEGGSFEAPDTFLSGTATERGVGVGVSGSTKVIGNLELSGGSSGKDTSDSNVDWFALMDIYVWKNTKINATGNLTMTTKGNSYLSVKAGDGKNTSITSGGNLNIFADSGNLIFNTGNAPESSLIVEATGGVNIQAKKGRVEMISTSTDSSALKIHGGKNNEVSLNGNAVGNAIGLSLSNVEISGGDVSLTGQTVSGDKTALKVVNSKITSTKADGKISLDGKTTGDDDRASGVRVESSTFSAQSLDVKGVAEKKGTGFTITKSTFDGEKLTVSSVGSATNVNNTLGKGIVTAENRESFLTNKPGNLTTVDMGGTDIFNDASKGLVADFTSPGTNGGFTFENTNVNAGDTVNLQGVGFKNSTITVNKGDFILQNKGQVTLDGTDITAEHDIKITADDGKLTINARKENGETIKSNIESKKGNISMTAYNSLPGKNGTGIELSSVNILADNGNIKVNGTTPGVFSGVRINNVTMSASTTHGLIDVYGESRGYFDDYQEFGSLYFGGKNSFTSKDMTFRGVNKENPRGSGVAFNGGSSAFDGKVGISGTGTKGVSFRSASLKFSNGPARIEGTSDKNSAASDPYYGAGAIYFDGWSSGQDVKVAAILDNASLDIIADSSTVHSTNPGHGVDAFAISNAATDNPKGGIKVPGMTFSGTGDVTLTGSSNDGTGVEARFFDNTGLNGKFTITGESNTGDGVLFDEQLNVNLVNANINGHSQSGTGIRINAVGDRNEQVNLNNNTLKGTSESSSGISVNGNNVGITDGYLDGTSNGDGDGVVFSGGENFQLTKTTVKGKSSSGNGVSAGGNLDVKDGEVNGITDSGSGVNVSGKLKVAGTTIKGESTGSGTGVKLAGNVEGDSPHSSRIEARSESGDGVSMADQTEVSLITVSGQADGDGDGISIAGNIKNTDSVLDGHAELGNGVSLGEGGTIEGGTVKAHSVRGTGFKAGSGSTLDGVSVKGTTADGVGVDVSDLKDRKGGTTITGEATGHGTSVQTEHDDGSRPDVVPPAPGGDTDKPATPDTTPPTDGDTDKHDSSAPELKPGTTEAVRQYIYEKQGVLSQPERLMNTVRVSGLRERSEPVNVEICTEGQCRQLNVGTVNGPARP